MCRRIHGRGARTRGVCVDIGARPPSGGSSAGSAATVPFLRVHPRPVDRRAIGMSTHVSMAGAGDSKAEGVTERVGSTSYESTALSLSP